LEEVKNSENHIFNSEQVQTGSHLREHQVEHPILSETEGEFENSLFNSLSDFDYSNESNEERSFFQKSANLSDELSSHNFTTDEIVEALVEVDETLDSGKNLVDYVNGSNELPKQSNNDLFDDSSNDSLMTDEIAEILMRFDETLDPEKKPMKYVMELSERQKSNKLFDESSNSQQVEYPIMEQTMAGKAVNQPGSGNNQVNFIEDQNQEYLIDEEKHPQNPHNIHNDRETGELIQKKQDKSIKNLENTLVNKSIKQSDKQPIPQTGHTLSILPQNVTKNDYLKYIQLYQSIQSVITRETFCNLLELSNDKFQKLLKDEEIVPDRSTNGESEYLENKRNKYSKEDKLEMVLLYLNSQHPYESLAQFCGEKEIYPTLFKSWLREYKKGKLTHT